jgi:hypothetical protein
MIDPNEPIEFRHIMLERDGGEDFDTRMKAHVAPNQVTEIRPVSKDDRNRRWGDQSEFSFHPMAATVITANGDDYFVPDRLDDLARMTPETTPFNRLPFSAQLIVATQIFKPSVVKLAISETTGQKPAPDPQAPNPGGDGYRPRRAPPKPVSAKAVALGVAGAIAFVGTVLVDRNFDEQARFNRTTSCTAAPFGGKNALYGARDQDGMTFTVDRTGQVIFEQKDPKSGVVTVASASVSGKSFEGYKTEPGAGSSQTEIRALEVCMERKTPILSQPQPPRRQSRPITIKAPS